VPEAYRTKTAGAIPKATYAAVSQVGLGNQAPRALHHAHDGSDDSCHLAELSHLAVLAYSEHLADR